MHSVDQNYRAGGRDASDLTVSSPRGMVSLIPEQEPLSADVPVVNVTVTGGMDTEQEQRVRDDVSSIGSDALREDDSDCGGLAFSILHSDMPFSPRDDDEDGLDGIGLLDSMEDDAETEEMDYARSVDDGRSVSSDLRSRIGKLDLSGTASTDQSSLDNTPV